MSVPHYEQEYGEPLSRHMANELGRTVAAAVCNDTPLTSYMRNQIEAAAVEACNRRSTVLVLFRVESRALKGYREDLNDVITLVRDHLKATAERKEHYETQPITKARQQLETVVDRRQEQLQKDTPPESLEYHELCSYLYEEEDWTYPVLRSAAVITRDLAALRSGEEQGKPNAVDGG
jgi:hypothetical protein